MPITRCLLTTLLLGASTALAGQQFADLGDLALESGGAIANCRLGYRTGGVLNDDKSNVVVFPTWFGGTTEDLEKYQVVGPGKLADTDRYYVIAIDALANGVSCSPSNSQAVGGGPVPKISIGDMVQSQHLLLTRTLGITHARAVMGISMGGMQTFQWIASHPGFMDKAVTIAGTPRQTSFDLIEWQTQRDVVRALQSRGATDAEIGPLMGEVSLLTVFTPDYILATVPREQLPAYLEQTRQGRAGFHADDYVAQLEAMIGQNVLGAGDEGVEAYVGKVKADVFIIGTLSDHMVNPQPGIELAQALGAEHLELSNNCGHLGSSCDGVVVGQRVTEFLAR